MYFMSHLLLRPSRHLFVSLFLGLTMCLTSCGRAPGQVNVIVLCSITKEHDRYLFPLQKVLLDKSGLELNLRTGQDMSGNGLRYHGQTNAVFPNKIIVSYAVKTNNIEPSFQLVETLAVIDEKIPALDNKSLSDFEKSLQKN